MAITETAALSFIIATSCFGILWGFINVFSVSTYPTVQRYSLNPI